MTLEQAMARVLETQKAYHRALSELSGLLKTEEAKLSGPFAPPSQGTATISERILVALSSGSVLRVAEICERAGIPADRNFRSAISRLKAGKKVVSAGTGRYRLP